MPRVPAILIALLLAHPACPTATASSTPDPRMLEAIGRSMKPVFTGAKGRAAMAASRAGRFDRCARAFGAIGDRARLALLRVASRYRQGRCHERAGDLAAAAKAYEEVRSARGLLEPLATLRLAVVRQGQGRTADALGYLALVEGDPALGRRVRAFRARVLEAASRDQDLVDAYGSSRSADLRLRVALARGRLGDRAGMRRDLLAAWLDRPRGGAGRQARDELARLEPACFGRGARRKYPCLSSEERLRLARGLFRVHASQAVIDLLEPRLARRGGRAAGGFRDPALRCSALVLVARAYDKLRKRVPGLKHYAEARTLCAGREEEPQVLYFGGRAAFREDRPDEAMRSFEALHKRLPGHSYNDDAVLYEAGVWQSKGRRKRADRLLRAAIDRYPKGDMRQDLAWRYVWSAIESGRRRLALKRIRDVLAKLDPAPAHDWRARGRLTYWRGRMAQRLGRRKEALGAYRQVLREARLSYHALLAYQRLRTLLGPRRARQEMRRALAGVGKPKGGAAPPSLKLSRTEGRVALLVRMDASEEASREIDALGTRAGADALLLFAELARRIDDPHLQVHILRRKLHGYQDLPPGGKSARIWKLAYPRGFARQVRSHARAAGVDPYLVWSIIREESGFLPRIESWANAIGLMQLLEPTARSMASLGSPVRVSPETLREPDTNIRLGVRFLRSLHRAFRHPALVIAGYNAGARRVRSWLKKRGGLPLDRFIAAIPFRQTRGYTMRVLQTWFRYQVLYGDGAPKLDMGAVKRSVRTKKRRPRRRRRKRHGRRR